MTTPRGLTKASIVIFLLMMLAFWSFMLETKGAETRKLKYDECIRTQSENCVKYLDLEGSR